MLVPLADVLPFRRVPWITLAIIAVHAATFLIQPNRASGSVQPGTLFDHVDWTAMTLAALRSAARHSDWLHLASNLAALWLFASTLEDRLGRLRFLLYYIAATLVAAGAVQAAWPGSVTALGASGGTLAVITAYLVMFPTSRILALFVPVFWIDVIEIPAVICMAVWLMLQVTSAATTLASGLGPPMPWQGYAAGAVWGVVTGVVVVTFRYPFSAVPPTRWRVHR